MGELGTCCSMSSSEAKDELEAREVEKRGEVSTQCKIMHFRKDEEAEEEKQSDDLYQNHKWKRTKKKQRSGQKAMKEGDGGGESWSKNGLMVRWERLLPRMALRVLLVESDDSTRQIIAALLRNCSYKVAAVPDGLKAWELLKERSHNIDLILTEEDLPSISGYALLSLIMEHEICKNIPVIMMSKEDSISIVYKCMMRGAADYLVKPIRRNELRNLWQHVWRRHSQVSRENMPQCDIVGQDRAEGASENNAASNHSTDDVAFGPENKDYIEKGSDPQSSCTKPDVEADTENVQDFLRPLGVNLTLNVTSELQRQEPCTDSKQSLPVNDTEARGSTTAKCKEQDAIILYKDIRAEIERPNTDINGEAGDSIGVTFNRERIDFMDAEILKKSSVENIKTKFDSCPDLDLSLRSSHSGELDTQVTEGRLVLRHSSTSAFTRYIGRSLHTQYATCASVCNEREFETNSERNVSNVIGNSSVTPSTSAGFLRTMSLPISEANESEAGRSLAQQRILSAQTPASDMRNSDSKPSNSYMFPPFLRRQPIEPQMPSPRSAVHPAESPEMEYRQFSYGNSSDKLYDRLGHASDCINTSLHKQECKLEAREIVSPLTDQSRSNGLCMGGVNHVNRISCGSNPGSVGNADQVGDARGAAMESKIEEGFFAHITNSHRSMLREAALNKFRLKRKERCFEKKVRYESRKKLAEQRPRVKGQFVRQAPVEAAPSERE